MLARLLPVLLVGACASTLPVSAPEQPMLVQLAMPYAQALRAVGISRVISVGRDAMVRLETQYGAVYVPYPNDLPPTTFILKVDPSGLHASALSFERERDARVLSVILPAAIEVTARNNAFQWLRANPWN